MVKTLILLGTAILLLAVAVPVSASDIIISKDRLPYFIGTYDAASNSFTSYDIEGWDTDPMSYTIKASALPQKDNVYYGQAPWYTNMANAILDVPEDNLVYATFVDLKRKHKVVALVTKWAVEGDNIRLVCISQNFPSLDAAPTLDGSFPFPDGTRFIVCRAGGGNQKKVWRQYVFLQDKGDCEWDVFFSLQSASLPYEKEYTESWCIMQAPVDPENYFMTVHERVFNAVSGPMADGSYKHEQVRYDSTVVSLWEIAQSKK
jgi:hypothetical protein